MTHHSCWFAVLSASLVCLLAPENAAQGGLFWQGIHSAPNAVVVQLNAKDYDVYYSGFMTVASPGMDPSEETGVGIGIQPGTVRQATEAEYVEESTGEPMDFAAELFPFQYEAVTTLGFSNLPAGRGLSWSGFWAPISKPVPGFQGGTLRFKFRLATATTLALFVKQIKGSKVAVAVAKSDKTIVKNNRLIMLQAPKVVQTGPIYYKFDRAVGDIVLNYSPAYAGAPSTAALSSTSGSPWTTGKFGTALSGGKATTHHACDTGWPGGLYGGFTVAWFMKQKNSPGTSTSRFFAGPGSFRCYTNGSAGTGIEVAGWSGNASALKLSADVQTKAASNWLHVALVVDGAAKKAVWFLDGVAQTPAITISKIPLIPESSTSTLVFGGAASNPNFYDLDEVRFLSFPVNAATVKNWSTQPSAANAIHGDSTGCLLRHKFGPPTLGNSSYQLIVRGVPSNSVGLMLGGPMHPPWSIFGGTWHVSGLGSILIYGATDTAGKFIIPAGIPNIPSLQGAIAYTQAFMPMTSKVAISNAHATAAW